MSPRPKKAPAAAAPKGRPIRRSQPRAGHGAVDADLAQHQAQQLTARHCVAASR